MTELKNRSNTGFTIIEVLIVLVLAGLVLFIVLVAIPQLQKNARDKTRKDYTAYLSAQIQTYRSHELAYPGDGQLGPDQRCDFIQNYVDTNSGCAVGPDACVTSTIQPFEICFRDSQTPHTFSPSADQYAIQLSHYCNPNQSSSEIILSTSSLDTDKHTFSVWTKLENGEIFCTDNY